MIFTVDTLQYKDLPRCAELEQQLFPGEDPWSERMFAAELDAGHWYVGARTGDSTLIGYAGLAVLGHPPQVETEVHTLAVDARCQGSGVGTKLLRVLLERADAEHAPVFLEVRTDNVPALALYAAHGFERIGLRRNYYQPSGADAYIMARPARLSEGMG